MRNSVLPATLLALGLCLGPTTPATAGVRQVVVHPGESIQAAMDCAQTYARAQTVEWPNHTLQDALFGRVILEPGTHDLHAPLATRAHVRIEAYGAEIINRADSHIMHVDDNGGGGYNAPATYWTIVGWVCRKLTVLSVAPLISDAMTRIHEETSLSSLFV